VESSLGGGGGGSSTGDNKRDAESMEGAGADTKSAKR